MVVWDCDEAIELRVLCWLLLLPSCDPLVVWRLDQEEAGLFLSMLLLLEPLLWDDVDGLFPGLLRNPVDCDDDKWEKMLLLLLLAGLSLSPISSTNSKMSSSSSSLLLLLMIRSF